MRNNTRQFLAGVALLSLAAVARAETTSPDIFEIEMPRGEGRALTTYFHSGSLRITGSDGDKVRVTATAIEEKEDRSEPESLAQDSRAQGLSKLTHTTTGLIVRQRDDGVEVLFLEPVASDVEIEMPRDATLKITSDAATQIVVIGMHNDVDIQAQRGDVFVHDARGSVKIGAVEGWIRLSEVTGPIEANTDFGAIEAALSEISADRPIWLSAAVGPIDIALPDQSNATLNLRSTWGDIYSDFKVSLEPKGEGLSYELPAPPLAATAPELSPQALAAEPRRATTGDMAQAVEEEPVPEADAVGRMEQSAAPPAEKKAARKMLTESRGRLNDSRTQPAAAPEAPPSLKRYSGRIGSGGVDIRLTTGSKNIYVRKLKK